MEPLRPETPEDLAEALENAARRNRRIRTGGAFSKDSCGGGLCPADLVLSTAALNGVLQYDPRDLTISVGAGMNCAELARRLAEDRLMLPLDPPLPGVSTIGGVVAANLSGPRRRLYGTARDMVIGMRFATLEGKLIETGGMVVKNVAGLDVAKLLIGSLGTLATLVSVNFRLHPMPPATRTFLANFDTAEAAIAFRDRILRSVLQPAAVDMANPAAAARLGRSGFLVAVQAGGGQALLGRYARELEGAADIEGEEESGFWRRVCDFAPDSVAPAAGGAVVRVSTTLSAVREVLETAPGAVLARSASGVSYAAFDEAGEAAAWAAEAAGRGWKTVVDWAAPGAKDSLELWPAPGGDLEVMQSIKRMFDPDHLLNKGRMYGRL